MQRAYDYKDVSLVPRVISTLKSRKEANTGIDCFGIHLDMPIIASPMPDVCNGNMAIELAMLGAIGMIHRFQDVQQQVEQYNMSKFTEMHGKNFICAIGATGDYQDRFRALYDAGCRIFCIDTANGANEQVGEAIKWIQDFQYSDGRTPAIEDKVYIIAGNVATAEGYRYLVELGVDAVRVGIGGGCFTPNMEILTNEGLKKIKDIQIGDLVFSHDGTLNNVENIFVFDRNEEIISINDVECTKNHKFYVVDKKCENIITDDNIHEYAKWISAEELDDTFLLIKV